MLAGLSFVLLKLWVFQRELAQSAADPYLWVMAVLLSVVYGLSEFFLPLGWLLLLRAQSAAPPRISWKEAWRLYGKSQIAKYIPGNVFHIAGRHMIASQKGMEHGTLFGAAILEIFLLVICAAALSLLSLDRNFALLKGIFSPFLTIFAVIMLLAFLAAVVIRNKIAVDRVKRLRLPHLWGAQLSYFAFFSLSCLLFLFVLTITSKEAATVLEKWNVIVGGYALAWVAGFLVPGAPGGVGVREAILLALLGTTLPVAGLLLGILVFRLINTMGDVGFYLAALIAEKAVSTPAI